MLKEAEDMAKKIEEMTTQSSSAQSQNDSGKFQPDINNQTKNLAEQFIDFALRGRDYLKIDLKELMNLKQIGEGAAAVVYKAQLKHTDVAVKKLKAQSLIVNNKLN